MTHGWFRFTSLLFASANLKKKKTGTGNKANFKYYIIKQITNLQHNALDGSLCFCTDFCSLDHNPTWESQYWDTKTWNQISNYDGVVLKIYLDHKLQWPQGDLNCESSKYEVVT